VKTLLLLAPFPYIAGNEQTWLGQEMGSGPSRPDVQSETGIVFCRSYQRRVKLPNAGRIRGDVSWTWSGKLVSLAIRSGPDVRIDSTLAGSWIGTIVPGVGVCGTQGARGKMSLAVDRKQRGGEPAPRDYQPDGGVQWPGFGVSSLGFFLLSN